MKLVLSVLLICSSVSVLASRVEAEEERMCQRLLETIFVNGPLIEGCEVGDILVLQITSNIAPGPLVGRFCDFRQTIFTETRPDGAETIVCVFAGERQSRPVR